MPDETLNTQLPDQAQEEQPFLTVSYDLTPEIYEKTIRHNLWVHFFKFISLVIGILLILDIVFNLYQSISYHIPFLDLMREFNYLKMDSFIWILYGAIILIYAVRLLVIQPKQLIKKTSEMFGNEQKWNQSFRFYDELIRLSSNSKAGIRQHDFTYGQISRVKIRKYDIMIRTEGKNAISIFREAISLEQEQQVLETLRTHCPQIRSLQR